MQADPPPPELDERQAQFMKARGFVWNAKSRSWAKGDPARAQRLEARSAARVVRWEGKQSDVSELALSCVRSATKRFEATLRDARDEALRSTQTDRKIALQIKDRIMKPYAVPAWLLMQVAFLAWLVDAGCVGLGNLSGPEQLYVPACVGLAFALLLSPLRRERWTRQPGIEDSDGALERLLVDAALGSYALPAPWEWRGAEPRWGAAVLAAEGLAGVNMAGFWHGGVQAAVVASTAPAAGEPAAAFLGILAVASVATARAAYFFDTAVDGVPAEVAAAASLAERAESYYGMTARSAEEASLSVSVVERLAEGWRERFGSAAGSRAEQLLLTSASAASCGVAWELGGRCTLAPAFALAFSAVDTYLLSPDAELTRVTLRLEDVEPCVER